MTEFVFNRLRGVATLVLGASLLLAACGGGSSSDSRQRNAALPVSNQRVGNTISAIAGGGIFSLALDDNGRLYGWGSGQSGQLTLPSLTNGGAKFTTIATGWNHSLALDDKGNLYAWGWNMSGQTSSPPLKADATKFTAVSAGLDHSVALDDNGNLYAWGSNRSGQTTVPAPVAGASKFTAIAAGANHSLALDDNGNLYAWGSNRSGQTTVPAFKNDASTFTSIVAGAFHTLALDEKGNLYAWGSNSSGQTTVPTSAAGATKFMAIAAGVNHSLALDDNGRLHAWGLNSDGQISFPPSLDGTLARSLPIAMGGLNALAVSDDGEVATFTRGLGGSDMSSYVSVAAGPRHALAITRSGTVDGWGDFEVGQIDIPANLSGVVQIAAGFAYSVALRSNGSVAEWGAHTAPRGKLIPMPDDLPVIKHIEGGLTHVLAITKEGTVIGWGNNQNGKATPPEGLGDVIDVAANDRCSVALKSNGDLVYWGLCEDIITEKNSLPGATAVAMSTYTAAAIVNGALIAWGEDWDETLSVPEGDDFVALAGGTAAFLAVTSTGMVSAWGTNHYETITIPESFGGAPPVVNDQVCDTCVEPEPFVWTDDNIKESAAFYTSIMTPDEQKKFIGALGGSTEKPMTPEEIQSLVDAASAKARAAALAEVNSAAQAAAQPSTAATIPASKSPSTKIGAKVSTTKAVTLLGLKKVTQVSFVKPKKAARACTVTARTITATQAGTCSVKVRYTDSKKKVRTKTLTLAIG